MQADGGLTATGAALNHDQTGVGLGDELELALVDERRDFPQVLVVRVGQRIADAELAGAVMLLGAEGAALAAVQARGRVVQADPAVLFAVREGALGGGDAPEL